MSDNHQFVNFMQFDASRSEWAEFLNKVNDLGYKQNEDYFYNNSAGNCSALFKEDMISKKKITELMKKHNVRTVSLEVDLKEEVRIRPYKKGDKVLVHYNYKPYKGEIVEFVNSEYEYKIQINEDVTVKRLAHEISIFKEGTSVETKITAPVNLDNKLSSLLENVSISESEEPVNEILGASLDKITGPKKDLHEDSVEQAGHYYLDLVTNGHKPSREALELTSQHFNIPAESLKQQFADKHITEVEEPVTEDIAGTKYEYNYDQSIAEGKEKQLDEHHLINRTDKVQFIKDNFDIVAGAIKDREIYNIFTADNIDTLSDNMIDDLYEFIEKATGCDKEEVVADRSANVDYDEYSNPDKFNKDFDFFGSTEITADDFKDLSNDDIIELANSKDIDYKGRVQTIEDLLYNGITKKDLEEFKTSVEESTKLDTKLENIHLPEDKYKVGEYGPETEAYKLYDGMGESQWEQEVAAAEEEGKELFYDSITDTFIVKNLEGQPVEESQSKDRYEVVQEDKETIKNIIKDSGFYVKDIRGMLKESKQENIYEIVVENKNTTKTIIYDDNKIVKPWKVEGKDFNFLQEAINFITNPTQGVKKLW